MSHSCAAEIKRYETTNELYHQYSHLCYNYFGWDDPPKNSFARLIIEYLSMNNMDPFLPSTYDKLVLDPIVEEIVEDLPLKLTPLPFVNNLDKLEKYIKDYIVGLNFLIYRFPYSSNPQKESHDKLVSLTSELKKFYSTQFQSNLRSKNKISTRDFILIKNNFINIRNKIHQLLDFLYRPIAERISNELLEKSFEVARYLKNFTPEVKSVNLIPIENSIIYECEGYRIFLSQQLDCKLDCLNKGIVNRWKMLQRYHTLMSIDKKSASLQAAVPYSFLKYLNREFDVDFECFASPMNCYFSQYCSAFKDTDEPFGSKGSFFDYYPKRGSFEANPPFIEGLMNKMVDHMHNLLSSTNEPLSFIIILPRWEDAEAIIQLKKSKYMRSLVILNAKEHEYREAGQGYHFKAVHDTLIFFLQNQKGYELWTPTERKISIMKEQFRG